MAINGQCDATLLAEDWKMGTVIPDPEFKVGDRVLCVSLPDREDDGRFTVGEIAIVEKICRRKRYIRINGKRWVWKKHFERMD